MKVVILAGGYGTRLSEYTDLIPKPMVTVGGIPIIWHIMKRYAKYGHKDFYLALGFKAELIKEYFINYDALNSDFTVDLKTGETRAHNAKQIDWNVTLIQTGLNSMTGGRLKRLKKFIGNETFLLTYGDGVADVNIDELVDFHKRSKRLVTVTAVRPTARFGELEINDVEVLKFSEKPQTGAGWINGGFFVMEPEFLDLIDGDDVVLEKEPLNKVSEMGELVAFRHKGSWQCMDTKRDRDNLESQWNSGNAFWDD